MFNFIGIIILLVLSAIAIVGILSFPVQTFFAFGLIIAFNLV